MSFSIMQPYSPSPAREGHDHNRNLFHRLHHSEQRYPIPAPAPSQTDGRTANSSISGTGGDEGKSDGGGADAESDCKESDDDHEDDVAPSDSAIILDDRQAGHTQEERAGPQTVTGQKRRRSVSPEGGHLESQAGHTHEERAGPQIMTGQKRIRSASPEGEDSTSTGQNELRRAEKVDVAEDISDADDYAGVDQISDFEEVEDDNIEQFEEGVIIASEDGGLDDFFPALDHSPKVPLVNRLGGFFIGDGQNHPSETPYFDQEYYRSGYNTADDAELHNPTVIGCNQGPPPLTYSERRLVRFELRSLSDSSPINDEAKFFQNAQFRSYRLETEGPKSRQRTTSVDKSVEGRYESLSGYDTDTEEEQMSLHRSHSLVGRATQSSQRQKRLRTQMPLAHRPCQVGKRAGPRMGSWVPSSTKPSVMMNKSCTGLIVFRISKEVRTERTTFHRVASGDGLANMVQSMSGSWFSDNGYFLNVSEVGASDSSSLEYAARFARSRKPVSIPPRLLHGSPEFVADEYRHMDEGELLPASPQSVSGFSFEEIPNDEEAREQLQGEFVDMDDFIDFSSDLVE